MEINYSEVRSQVRSQARSVEERSYGPYLPNRDQLVAYFKGPTMEDSVGVSSRDIQQKQYMTGGTLTHADIVGDETVVGNGGTGSVAVSAGTLTITGTVWDIELSNGWKIPFGNSTIGKAWEVVAGVILTMTGVTCGTSLVDGSDWLNQMGYTIADGLQYYDEDIIAAVPPGVLIPSLSIGAGCAAYTIEGVSE